MSNFVEKEELSYSDVIKFLKKHRNFELNNVILTALEQLKNELPCFDYTETILTVYTETGMFSLPFNLFFQMKGKILNAYSVRNLEYKENAEKKRANEAKLYFNHNGEICKTSGSRFDFKPEFKEWVQLRSNHFYNLVYGQIQFISENNSKQINELYSQFLNEYKIPQPKKEVKKQAIIKPKRAYKKRNKKHKKINFIEKSILVLKKVLFLHL